MVLQRRTLIKTLVTALYNRTHVSLNSFLEKNLALLFILFTKCLIKRNDAMPIELIG